jgi:hypothetical protein
VGGLREGMDSMRGAKRRNEQRVGGLSKEIYMVLEGKAKQFTAYGRAKQRNVQVIRRKRKSIYSVWEG